MMVTDLESLDSLKPDLRLKFRENGDTLLNSVSKEHEKLRGKSNRLKELKDKLGSSNKQVSVNFGGTCLEVDRKVLNSYPNCLMFRFALMSGRYDHLLPKDKNGNTFLDLNAKWVQSHLGLIQDTEMWDGDEEKRPQLARVHDVDVETSDALSVFYNEEMARTGLNVSSLILKDDVPKADAIFNTMLTDKKNKSTGRGLKSTLLYRGSRDGFTAAAFHAKCDGHKDTISVIRNTVGDIFGVYSDKELSSAGNWTQSTNGFLFNLRRGAGGAVQPVKHKVVNSATVFYCAPNVILHAGNSRDLSISAAGCNTSMACTSTMSGATFETLGQTSLTSAPTFQVTEIEVFEVELSKTVKVLTPRASLIAKLRQEKPPAAPEIVVPVVNADVLPSIATSLQATTVLFADVQQYCMELIRLDFELQQEATAFRDELRFVAQRAGITLPAARRTTSTVPAKIYDKLMCEIEATIELMCEVSARPVSADDGDGSSSSTSNETAKMDCSSIVTIKAGGQVIAVSKATLRLAPSGSVLFNLASDAWGHDTDGDGDIVQRVNPHLLTLVIDHLRLKALLPAADVPPIVIYKEDKAALDNVLAFYAMSDAPVKCI